ncbi:unnamed protein product, partial [Adineta steineri]
MLITQTVEQDIRSVVMTVMNKWKFQCANTTCLPFTKLNTQNLIGCQVACLVQSQCEAVTYHLLTSNCELFMDISNQSGNMMTDIDTNTMIVISEARSSPAFTAQWNSTGKTVAGDAAGSSGIASNRLNFPYELKIDSSNALYITDYNNNRIQKWIAGASNGATVAGQINGASGQSSTLLYTPVGLVLDSNDNMYFSDRGNSRIMFWRNGASSGSMIAGTGIGGNANNQLQNPSMIEYVPSTNILYIADTMNHRIMKYLLNASSGIVVAGGNGQGLSNTQLSKPYGMALDLSTNSLIICNYGANTVVRWILGANSWTLIAGSISGTSGSSATLLYQPVGVTLDQYGNIYVADSGNHRIQCFLVGHSAGMTIAGTGSPG